MPDSPLLAQAKRHLHQMAEIASTSAAQLYAALLEREYLHEMQARMLSASAEVAALHPPSEEADVLRAEISRQQAENETGLQRIRKEMAEFEKSLEDVRNPSEFRKLVMEKVASLPTTRAKGEGR